MVIKQTSIVDLSVIEAITGAISSSSIITVVHSKAPSISSTSAGKEEQPLDPTDSPSMFSTSMAPPRPTQAGQEEELITTAAPTIREDSDDLPDFDHANENLSTVRFVPPHGDTFKDPLSVRESATATEPGPTEEQDDLSVIEINTIQPDVPMLDPSLITEPMFAEGKTEETILVPGITVVTTSDLADNPTETTEVNEEEVFISSESMPTSVYDVGVDEIETHFGVEALPPTHLPEQDFFNTPDDIHPEMSTVSPTETTYMCNTQPGGEAHVAPTEAPEPTSTTAHTTRHTQNAAAAILPDSGDLAEDESASSVQVIEESTGQLTEHSGDTLTQTDATTEIDPEFFTSFPVASAASHTTRPPTTAATHTSSRSEPLTTSVHLQQAGKTVKTPSYKPLYS